MGKKQTAQLSKKSFKMNILKLFPSLLYLIRESVNGITDDFAHRIFADVDKYY